MRTRALVGTPAAGTCQSEESPYTITESPNSNEDNTAGNGHHGWGSTGALDNLKALNVASGNAGDGGESPVFKFLIIC